DPGTTVPTDAYQLPLDRTGPVGHRAGQRKLLVERPPVGGDGVEVGEVPGTVTDLQVDDRTGRQHPDVVQPLKRRLHGRLPGDPGEGTLVDQIDICHRQAPAMISSSPRSGPPALLTSRRRRSARRSASAIAAASAACTVSFFVVVPSTFAAAS